MLPGPPPLPPSSQPEGPQLGAAPSTGPQAPWPEGLALLAHFDGGAVRPREGHRLA